MGLRSSLAAALVVTLSLVTGAQAEVPQDDTVTRPENAAGATPEATDVSPNVGIPPEYVWTNVVTDFDRDRLARLDEAIALGNEESYGASATIRERAAFHKVMDAQTAPVNDADLLGWWACRTIKVGGNFAGLVVYSWFDCKGSVRDGVLFFEKRSGSQRLSGRLYQDGSERRVLLAAPTYNDEPQRTYSGPEGGITDPQRQDKVGVLSQLDDGRLRVVFPWSVLESTYDVLELRRPE